MVRLILSQALGYIELQRKLQLRQRRNEQKVDALQMQRLAVEIRNLTAALQAWALETLPNEPLRRKLQAGELSRCDRRAQLSLSAEVMRLATRHDPALLAPFHDWALFVTLVGEEIRLIVCDTTIQSISFIDHGFTAKLDRQPWHEEVSLPLSMLLTASASATSHAKAVASAHQPAYCDRL